MGTLQAKPEGTVSRAGEASLPPSGRRAEPVNTTGAFWDAEAGCAEAVGFTGCWANKVVGIASKLSEKTGRNDGRAGEFIGQ